MVESPSEASRLACMPADPADRRRTSCVNSNPPTCSLFDGTFWSDNELIHIQGSGQTAQQMGHVPVSLSLEKLAQLRRPRKIYVHINNTNPMLNEAGPEYRQARDAGWEIAEDGWRFDL